MKKVRSINFSPDEFLVGIAGLRASEVGYYWVICSLIYSSGGPIPMDDERLFRVLKEPRNKGMGFITSLINKGKLYLESIDGVVFLAQTRCVGELRAAQTRIENSQKNGRLGGRPSKKSDTSQNPEQKPITTTTTNYINPKSGRPVDKVGEQVNKLNGDSLRASHASEPSRTNGANGHDLAKLKAEKWQSNVIRFMQTHWPAARVEKAVTEYLSETVFGAREFETANSEMRAEAKRVSMIEGE